jgi:hypothetical protein
MKHFEPITFPERTFQYATEGQPIEGRRHLKEITPDQPSLDRTFAQRNARYGDFRQQADIGERIRDAMEGSPNWSRLTPSMRLALLWISDKIARILSGDPFYEDSWHDVAGYATLIERELRERK